MSDEKNAASSSSPPYVVCRPADPSPFIFNSAHSGREYSDEFLRLSRLDALSVRKSEDSFVEELFGSVVERGATLLHALFPRAFVDTNREPLELDPLLFDEDLPQQANTQSARVMAGLGTIARVVTESEEIYAQKPSLQEALSRINHYYRPYHDALDGLLSDAVKRFGYAVLVDCHSMPSISVLCGGRAQADFVLGDRFGTSCSGAMTTLVENKLRALGYGVLRNKPYAGGFTTEHYGRPREGVHALQIEINRALYLNEDTFVKKPGFDQVRQDLDKVVSILIEQLPDLVAPRRMAAE